MLYVLFVLVVALALVNGAMFAMLKIHSAEHHAEVTKLTCKNRELERKVIEMSRLNNVREGLN